MACSAGRVLSQTGRESPPRSAPSSSGTVCQGENFNPVPPAPDGYEGLPRSWARRPPAQPRSWRRIPHEGGGAWRRRWRSKRRRSGIGPRAPGRPGRRSVSARKKTDSVSTSSSVKTVTTPMPTGGEFSYFQRRVTPPAGRSGFRPRSIDILPSALLGSPDGKFLRLHADAQYATRRGGTARPRRWTGPCRPPGKLGASRLIPRAWTSRGRADRRAE